MVLSMIPRSSPALDEELDSSSLLESPTLLHRINTDTSQTNTIITVVERHTEGYIIPDAPFADEPDPIFHDRRVTPSPIPVTHMVFANLPSPKSAAPSHHHSLPSDSGIGKRPKLSPSLSGNQRKNTRRSTVAHALPPKFTLDDATRGPQKHTLRRGLSISLLPGIAP
ncbi:hypothetical protein BDQ17DRAFT_589439 [Cyathus striatus]|nr:hypothetical protein BDQ17DRAFT_589439 [Cyathus striatus]